LQYSLILEHAFARALVKTGISWRTPFQKGLNIGIHSVGGQRPAFGAFLGQVCNCAKVSPLVLRSSSFLVSFLFGAQLAPAAINVDHWRGRCPSEKEIANCSNEPYERQLLSRLQVLVRPA
jgi:hypothetical protein